MIRGYQMVNRIREQGYRPLIQPSKRQSAWRSIADNAFAMVRRRRATKVFGLFTFAILGGHSVWLVSQILFAKASGDVSLQALGTGAILGDTREVLASFFSIQFFVMALAIAALGAGIVADDIENDVLSVYFSRRIPPQHYLQGKLAALGAVPLVGFVAPGLILWFIAIGISPEILRGTLWAVVLPTIGVGAVGAVVLTLPMLALSSILSSHRSTSVIYLSLFLFAAPVMEGLARSGYGWLGYLSPERSFRAVVTWALEPEQTVAGQLFDMRSGAELESVAVAGLALIVFAGASAVLAHLGLKRRIQ